MSKILAVADIHIHAYPNRNPDIDYRLYQGSRVVADNIIEAGKNNGCDYIVLAGDIVEKSIIRPYVQAEVKLFLEKVMSHFKEGWLIYGNHDVDGKTIDQSINDSILGIVLPPNLHYAHQSTIQLDSTLIGFSNWQPEFDLSWINGKVDILFTHARICYSDSDLIQSQVLDESKFDLAICGDIHKPGQIGKYVSIGIPQRCKMSDGDKCTGVVVDTLKKSWNWVELNPHDNLMKFAYTYELDKSGWDKDSGTWYIYKQDPKNQIISAKTTVEAWNEIGNLIENSIKANSLEEVHSEVLKNIKDIDAGEVDFNFTLTKFHCKNWRSIDEVTMNFADGDKILIQGGNGSGKSSLLSALKYAFIDVGDTKGLTSLKPFIQFGAKECMTEVEFIYQGMNYRLRRGTKEFGLWINEVQQKYSDKRAFEADVRIRFPFIQYMDVFFLDADHNQLIGGMSVEKKSLIVSKFLKLDRIDTFHDTAMMMSDNLKKENSVWTSKIKESERILGFINDKLNVIVLPSTPKETLIQQRNEGLEIQRKNALWNKFVTESASYQATISACQEKLKELYEAKSNFRNVEIIDNEIQTEKSEIAKYQGELIELGNIKTKLQFKSQEIENLKKEGNNAWIEAQSIGLGKTCKHCGQVIKTSETLQKHKEELLQKVENLKAKKSILDQELAALTETWNNSETEWNRLNMQIESCNHTISMLLSEKNHQDMVMRDIDTYTQRQMQAESNLQSLGIPEKVELPDRFMEIMNGLTDGIAVWENWESLMNDKSKAEAEMMSYTGEIDKITAKLSALDAYINLTGPTGVIYNEILTKLAEQFSDSMVNYVVKKYSNRGNHLNLESQYFNNGNWVDYGACSSGQKTVLDVNFLQKIVSRLGLLVMDEFLKHLDPENHDICLEMISQMNIGCIMISSHMESIAAFNNKSCKLSLSGGLTKIDFE